MQLVEQLPDSRKLPTAHDEQVDADEHTEQAAGHAWHCVPSEYSLTWHDDTHSVWSAVNSNPGAHVWQN